MRLDEKTGFSLDELIAIFDQRKLHEAGEPTGERNLRAEEYDALVRGRPETPDDIDFATLSEEVPESLKSWFAQVQLVTRLREVRALSGFARILPPRGPDGEGANVVSLMTDEVDWLPAIEVKGEGIFLRLDADRVAEWAGRPGVVARAESLDAANRRRHEQWGTEPDRTITAEFLLLHALAHALIGQLALDAGYPAGSLRERLYHEDGALGVLLYTATTDSAGSLGGLIAQGRADRLENFVREGVARMAWCSSDPVCIESEATGADSLNLAACHSCALLPETSCEEMNGFLDRATLVGTRDDSQVGFFEGI